MSEGGLDSKEVGIKASASALGNFHFQRYCSVTDPSTGNYSSRSDNRKLSLKQPEMATKASTEPDPEARKAVRPHRWEESFNWLGREARGEL